MLATLYFGGGDGGGVSDWNTNLNPVLGYQWRSVSTPVYISAFEYEIIFHLSLACSLDFPLAKSAHGELSSLFDGLSMSSFWLCAEKIVFLSRKLQVEKIFSYAH